MKYVSTRGGETPITSSDAIIKGLANDGGLFVPDGFPAPYETDMLKQIAEYNYKELAFEIMTKFFTDFTEDELKSCINNAYDEKFDTYDIAPIVKTGGAYFLELFHGRTLAFKDMALSILPHLMKTAAAKTGIGEKILILAATSGDTGKAAMEGFKDVGKTAVIVFYPKDGVSAVQKLQMTTQQGKNVACAAVEGNFDDCQTAVKNIFADESVRKELKENGVIISSANSINIGRLVPQIVYYFYGYLQLVSGGEIEVGEQINFCVPTGNFGNILAGHYARKLGLPIKNLICASNENKVLYDFFKTGEYNANRPLYVTNSPSMDILISSNLERLIYDVSANSTKDLMNRLKQNGSYMFNADILSNNGFVGAYATQKQCLEAINNFYDDTGYIMDTHTAVAFCGSESYAETTGDDIPTIIISTASPYKFAGSVIKSINPGMYKKHTEMELINELAFLLADDVPEQIKDLDKKEVIHNYICQKDMLKEFIIKRCKCLL